MTTSSQGALRIGEVARRTGMSTAALRAWESRYGLLTPLRTEGGQRLYSDADVDRIRAVQGLVAQGWSVVGAVRHVLDDLARAVEPEDRPATPSGAEVAEKPLDRRVALVDVLAGIDAYAVLVTYETARAMLRATDAVAVRDALVELVERLGGHVGPAAVQDDAVLPADLSLGEGPPLLPRAPATSLARMRLEAVLPLVLEDARTVVHRLQLGVVTADRRS